MLGPVFCGLESELSRLGPSWSELVSRGISQGGGWGVVERDRLKRTLLQLMRVVLVLVLVNGGFSLFLFRIWG